MLDAKSLYYLSVFPVMCICNCEVQSFPVICNHISDVQSKFSTEKQLSSDDNIGHLGNKLQLNDNK